MNSHSPRIPRVLCPEDKQEFEDQIREALTDPSDKLRDMYGAGPFEVIPVRTSEEAEEHLREAHENMRPFDVLLLDLELPFKSGYTPSVKEGIELLGLVRTEYTNSCNAVIVQTVNTQFEHVRDVVRLGIADFLEKPFKDKELFAAVAAACKRSNERLASRWYELQSHRRQRWIIAQACTQVADDLGDIVIEGMANVQQKSDNVARTFEREFMYDLQRDQDETICRGIVDLNVATKRVTSAFASERPEFHQPGGVEPLPIEELLRATLSDLATGFSHKRITLRRSLAGNHVIQSFRDETEAMFRELLFGAIEASPEDSKLVVSVRQTSGDDFVEVEVTDSGPPLPIERIEEVDYRSENQRLWIVSLVKRVAESIGSRLVIRPGDDGNRIVLQLRDHG